MRHSFRFQRSPRDANNSVLFWAFSLVESQRPQSNSKDHAVLIQQEEKEKEQEQEGQGVELIEKVKEEVMEVIEVIEEVQEECNDVEREMKRARREQETPQEEVIEQEREELIEEEEVELIEEEEEVELIEKVKEEEEVFCTVSSSTITVAAPATTIDNITQRRDYYRFKDILSISGSLLEGLLGPVALDVELNGSISLLREPERFAASLNTMEKASSNTMQNFHASIQLFFSVRGESFYTLRAPAVYNNSNTNNSNNSNSNTSMSTVCSPVVFLAKLLSAPAVMKIVLHASYLYRLLFLFLGTDRISVCNVVDVQVWSSVMGRVCGQHQRTPPCVNIQHVWEFIPNTAQERISLLLQNAKLAAQYDESLWKEITEEMNITASPLLVSSTSGKELPVIQLTERLKSLSALYAYYDQYLQPLKSSGTVGTNAMSIATVCDVETRVRFLCEVMSYHGMFVNKHLLDSMLIDLDQQIEVLTREGNEALEVLQISITAKRKERREKEVVSIIVVDEVDVEEVDIGSITAEKLVKLLREEYGSVVNIRDSYERQLHHFCTYMYNNGCEEGNVAYIWLAIRERREFRQSLMDGFKNGANIHARIIHISQEEEEENENEETTITIRTDGDETTLDSNNNNNNNNNIEGQRVHDGVLRRSLFFSVHPKWEIHHNTTGRLYCSKPCLQTLSKKPVLCRTILPTKTKTTTTTTTTETETPSISISISSTPSSSISLSAISTTKTLFTNPLWTPRHMYGPPPGCTLISFDYNQIELRLLAHLSGDALLIQQLRSGRDVLSEMARRLMGIQQIESVTPYMRQAVKVVVYGMLYGMGPDFMDQRLQQLQQDASIDTHKSLVLNARQFLRAFQESYPAANAFLKNTRMTAYHEKRCVTLNGIRDLSSELDGNRRKQIAIAVAIQGGAAVILHHGMIAVHEKRHTFLPHFPAAAVALVMSVHDELVYVVPDAAVALVAPQIKRVLEHQSTVLSLLVPLPVSVQAGKSLGEMEPLEVSM